jgi:hypothetical protein
VLSGKGALAANVAQRFEERARFWRGVGIHRFACIGYWCGSPRRRGAASASSHQHKLLGDLLNLLLEFRRRSFASQLLKLLLDLLQLLLKLLPLLRNVGRRRCGLRRGGLSEYTCRCAERGGYGSDYGFPHGLPPVAHVITALPDVRVNICGPRAAQRKRTPGNPKQ